MWNTNGDGDGKYWLCGVDSCVEMKMGMWMKGFFAVLWDEI